MIDAADRGFNYGDGVFETVLLADGAPVWLDAHLARLRRGCDALRFAYPEAAIQSALARACAQAGERAGAPRCSVLKLVVTRGAGGRGYAPPRDAAPTVVATRHEAPATQRDGIEVRWCDLRLSQQPALAGLKHLNRLENVLARGEWDDPAIGEGLLLDAQERVAGATAANVFVVRDGEFATPPVTRCGVAGIARDWVMRQAGVEVRELQAADIEAADELFLTSSLRGILPVARLGGRRWNVGPMTRRLQQLLFQQVPALEPRA